MTWAIAFEALSCGICFGSALLAMRAAWFANRMGDWQSEAINGLSGQLDEILCELKGLPEVHGLSATDIVEYEARICAAFAAKKASKEVH